jgi:hypothetical protein
MCSMLNQMIIFLLYFFIANEEGDFVSETNFNYNKN